MVQGMTGFGSSEKDGFRVEVRSLNHRFLEITVKIPPLLGKHEIQLRDGIKERFGRGRFDVFISVMAEAKVRLKVNKPLVREIASVLNSLKEELGIERDLSIETLLIWKDILMTEELEYEAGPLFKAFEECLTQIEEMRLKEGEAIKTEVIKGVEKIEAFNNEVISLSPSAQESARQRFIKGARLFLPEEGLDESRLLYEAVRAAEKADIKEEVLRIKAHLEYMRKNLLNGGKIGKTLDFILQELLREVNTIASKTEEQGMAKIAIDMKTEIEGIREQVQNIQ